MDQGGANTDDVPIDHSDDDQWFNEDILLSPFLMEKSSSNEDGEVAGDGHGHRGTTACGGARTIHHASSIMHHGSETMIRESK